MSRETYKRLRAIWAPFGGDPYVDRINAMPKHVASRSLPEVSWKAELLGPDTDGEVQRLEEKPGRT